MSLTNNKFSIGENVENRTTKKIGTVNKILETKREFQYAVTFEGKRITISERDLAPYIDLEDKISNDIRSNSFGNNEDFELFHTWLRLSLPLENNLYSYLSSRTIFNPYQFKPLLRFLSPGSGERLFIADEVGVGKTIETGIILSELYARGKIDSSSSILIICPNSITRKWEREMKNRFNLDFFVHQSGSSLKEMLKSLEETSTMLPRYKLSIVGLQLLRGNEYYDKLVSISGKRSDTVYGMVVVDEAHHLRNSGTNSYRLGKILSGMTDMMIMLSATPLNLNSNDLFNQLHLLNPFLFEDIRTFQSLQNPIKNINNICSVIFDYPGSRQEILILITELKKDQIGKILLDREWVNSFINKIEDKENLSTPDLVKYERLFSSLNPLYSSFTRTRKREAIEHQVQREAIAVPIVLSNDEKIFQEEALRIIKDYFTKKGYSAFILNLIINTHRRMISSSIPSMREYLNYAIQSNEIESGTFDSDEEIIEDDEDYEKIKIGHELKTEFLKLIKLSTYIERNDSKYNQFKNLIDNQIKKVGVKQIIVFSFFIHTLEYLKRRLNKDEYTAEVIHGKVPINSEGGVKGREEIMRDFKKGDFQILLSSEVGGEGLDFQFCNTIINYDLPYNPMKVEQRIGRIDRFGQKSDKITIINIFISGTVDEEIYDRLYRRIRLVEDGVGALEPIMGKEIADLAQGLSDGTFSEEMKEEYQKRIELAVIQKKREMETFENHRRELLSDNFLAEPINELDSKNLLVPEDIIQLTKLFLSQYDDCSFNNKGNDVYAIRLSKHVKEELEMFLSSKDGLNGYLELHPLILRNQEARVVFDGGIADQFDDYIFLPPTGYWSKFVTRKLNEENRIKRIFKFNLIENESLPHDKNIMIFIFQVKFEGSRNIIELLAIPIDIDLVQIIRGVDYSNLIRDIANANTIEVAKEFVFDNFQLLLDEARKEISLIVDTKRNFMSDENRSFLSSRITAFETSSKQKIERNKVDIENHKGNRQREGKEPDQNYIRMTEAKIVKEERLIKSKVNELKNKLEISTEYNLEAIIYIPKVS